MIDLIEQRKRIIRSRNRHRLKTVPTIGANARSCIWVTITGVAPKDVEPVGGQRRRDSIGVDGACHNCGVDNATGKRHGLRFIGADIDKAPRNVASRRPCPAHQGSGFPTDNSVVRALSPTLRSSVCDTIGALASGTAMVKAPVVAPVRISPSRPCQSGSRRSRWRSRRPYRSARCAARSSRRRPSHGRAGR